MGRFVFWNFTYRQVFKTKTVRVTVPIRVNTEKGEVVCERLGLANDFEDGDLDAAAQESWQRTICAAACHYALEDSRHLEWFHNEWPSALERLEAPERFEVGLDFLWFAFGPLGKVGEAN